MIQDDFLYIYLYFFGIDLGILKKLLFLFMLCSGGKIAEGQPGCGHIYLQLYRDSTFISPFDTAHSYSGTAPAKFSFNVMSEGVADTWSSQFEGTNMFMVMNNVPNAHNAMEQIVISPKDEPAKKMTINILNADCGTSYIIRPVVFREGKYTIDLPATYAEFSKTYKKSADGHYDNCWDITPAEWKIDTVNILEVNGEKIKLDVGLWNSMMPGADNQAIHWRLGYKNEQGRYMDQKSFNNITPIKVFFVNAGGIISYIKGPKDWEVNKQLYGTPAKVLLLVRYAEGRYCFLERNGPFRVGSVE
jgi:hypothetical protein